MLPQAYVYSMLIQSTLLELVYNNILIYFRYFKVHSES